jgi:hypothetical protein
MLLSQILGSLNLFITGYYMIRIKLDRNIMTNHVLRKRLRRSLVSALFGFTLFGASMYMNWKYKIV